MSVIPLVVVIIVVITLAFLRNEWLYREIIKTINQDCDDVETGKIHDVQDAKFKRLPSYFYMFLHFWVWDIEKFVSPKD
jgi:hypothetical protein